MGLLYRKDYSRGWLPSVDANNCPDNGLLRMDNCVLDEIGNVGARPGMAKINAAALADIDVHSLYTCNISGTRYRMAGAGGSVYANGASIKGSLTGSNIDMQFAAYLGQIFFSRSTEKWKYDGTTVRPWGIAAPGASTIAAVPISSSTKDFATCKSSESPAIASNEGTQSFVTDKDGNATSATQIIADATTFRGTSTRTLSAQTDYTTYSAGITASDDDVVEMYVKVDDPTFLDSVTLEIDVNDGTFNTFYYSYTWNVHDVVDITLSNDQAIANSLDIEGPDRQSILSRMVDTGAVSAQFRPDKAAWNYLSVKRGQMTSVNATGPVFNWSTVKAIRVTFSGPSQATCVFQGIRLVGGSTTPLDGTYVWRYLYVRDTGGPYVATGIVSNDSNISILKNQGATITIANPTDTQVTHAWVYRMGGTLDRFYRTAVKTISAYTGTTTVVDATDDITALNDNIYLETDNTLPPSSMVGISEDYYTRIFCLTSTYLYPSRKLNPEAFSAGQSIRIGGGTEINYWIRRALGGLYIGTSKDIYRLDGTGDENDDGTVDFKLTNVNIGNPPISPAHAVEGNAITYLAADGWRQFTGQDSIRVGGLHTYSSGINVGGVPDVDPLYRGITCYDVPPVNIADPAATPYFRAAIAKGKLVAVTPEGSQSFSSKVIHRYDFGLQRWYRHTYFNDTVGPLTQGFRSLFREPDGTLIAGDNSGFVWTLDTGIQDGDVDIPVTIWTKNDDNGQPMNRKDLWDYQTRLRGVARVDFYLDGHSPPALSVSAVAGAAGTYSTSLDGLPACTTIQRRFTASNGAFRLLDENIQYREHPTITRFQEEKPGSASAKRRRFGGLTIQADTLGGTAVVTPVLDDVDQAAQGLSTTNPDLRTISITSAVGRDLWAKIAAPGGVEVYGIQPIVLEELPQQFEGRVGDSTFSYDGEKVLAGLKFTVCTLGQLVTLTPILDGVALPASALSVISDTDLPSVVTLQFPSPQTATKISYETDGVVEMYSWEPVVLYKNPMRRLVWDTGPIAIPGTANLAWLRQVKLKVNTPVDLTLTPYLDGVAQAPVTVPTGRRRNVATVFEAPLGRGVKAREPRLLITASAGNEFQPYWIELYYSTTGNQTQKLTIRPA